MFDTARASDEDSDDVSASDTDDDSEHEDSYSAGTASLEEVMHSDRTDVSTSVKAFVDKEEEDEDE